MVKKLSKEKIEKLLEAVSSHKNEESELDKLENILSLTKDDSSQVDPMMMLLLSNTKGSSGDDKLAEAIYRKELIKALRSDDTNIKDIIQELDKRTDEKIEALKQSFENTLNKTIEMLKETLPKPKSKTEELLEELIKKISNSDKKEDSTDTLIKLIQILGADKKQDPLDTFSKMYSMVNEGNEKYIKLKEEMMQKENEATREQLQQALEIIRNNRNNQDWMEELKRSTRTINEFKKFMEESGLKPTPKAEKGKIDMKFILDSISDIVGKIAPAIPPPQRKPTWDIDREAHTLYAKYKDILRQPDGSPLTEEFVKEQLLKSPNIEELWQDEIKKAYEEQQKAESEEIKKGDEEIENLIKEIVEPENNETENAEAEDKEEETDVKVEDEEEKTPKKEFKPKTVKGQPS